MSDLGHIFCVGLNHETAPVEIRERVAFAEKELSEASLAVSQLDGFEEAVVLSTCNRMEIYGSTAQKSGADEKQYVERLESFLRARFGVETEPLHLYQHGGVEAARHLFRVASGLDSMVLGETEIFGQVKKAYLTAHSSGATGKTVEQIVSAFVPTGQESAQQYSDSAWNNIRGVRRGRFGGENFWGPQAL